MADPVVKPGLESLQDEEAHLVEGCRVGLLTHAAARTRTLDSAVDLIAALPNVDLKVILAPEHGLTSHIGDAVEVPDYFDEELGLPVVSLYGSRSEPPADVLEEIDVVVCDLVDVGARFYTYTGTLYHLMKGCVGTGTRIVVCDRPNPVGGLVVEGPVAGPRFLSEFAVGPLPVRHGLSIGELAKLYTDVWQIDVELDVVSCRGWIREMYFANTGLLWVPPSPAMPHADTAVLYPGSCLFEGTNLSEGRGTALPFEQIGAPWFRASEVLEQVDERATRGVLMRSVYFVPDSGDWAGEICAGIQIHVADRTRCRPVLLALALLRAIRALHRDTFRWRLPHFDLLTADDRIRQAIEAEATLDELFRCSIEGHSRFEDERKRVLTY